MAHHLKPRPLPRLLAAVGLVLVVAVVHVGLADKVAMQIAAFAQPQPEVRRLQVAYVREMAFTAPVTRSAAAPVASKRRTVASAAARAASAAGPAVPEASAPAPAPAPAPATEPAPEPAPLLAQAGAEARPALTAATSAATPAAPFASEPAAPAFEWPVSTRMRYLLTGYVRGEVHGQAQVEWIRAGQRYQVHLDVEVGPSFAPLATRRMSSEGDITPEGLQPQRYVQETRLAFQTPYRAVVRFDGARVWLANGATVLQAADVQDTASQFVQIAYLFDREPARLRVGEAISVLLAMPRRVSTWVYDVVAQETLYTPFGQVPAYHLKPRREPQAGGDLVTELWIAPALRHLPVRFRIHQDAENHVDLMLDRRPELAVSDPAPTTPPTTPP